MVDLFRPSPATASQLNRLRRLARWPGMPNEAAGWVEEQIAGGLTVQQAWTLIGKLGKRVANIEREEHTP